MTMRDWYQKHGIDMHEARRLERALCTLADFEGQIKSVLRDEIGDGASDHDHAHVCAALRHLVDGWEGGR